MRMKMLAFAAASVASIGVAQAASEADEKFWNLAAGSQSVAVLEAFLEQFPDTTFRDEATQLIAKLEDDARRREFEDNIFELSGAVIYDRPLSLMSERLRGHSIQSILKTSPEYSPVEGLPEAMWKDATCSDCHSWTREALCTQAGNYLKQDPSKYQNKKHPFGGVLKINLRNWAKGGCQ